MKSRFGILTSFIFFLPLLGFTQGYYNQENFGNRSLLLSGNVTGSVDDLGLTYYNPARIALIEEPVFSINAKAYQVSNLSFKNIFGRDEKLGDTRFEGVPSLLAGTFKIDKWEKHHFAYAFLSKKRSQLNINAVDEVTEGDIVDGNDDLERLASSFEFLSRETDEWFGMSWGMKVKDNFSVGVSAFVSVYNRRGTYDLKLAALDPVEDVDFYYNEVNFAQSSYGMFWKVGLAWQLKNFNFGLNIDLPYLEVIKSGKFRYGEFLSGIGEGDDLYNFGDLDGLESNRKEPFAVSLGAGIPWKKNTIHVKVDWHGAVSEYDRLVIPVIEDGPGEPEEFRFKEKLKSVVNFGLGLEFYLTETMNLFASFSTDFSPIETNANIFDLVGDQDRDVNIEADYIHYGLGVDFKFKRANITIGTTYSSARDVFDRAIDFPDPDDPDPLFVNEDPSEIRFTRWRFIVGLEFPIFGYDVNFK